MRAATVDSVALAQETKVPFDIDRAIDLLRVAVQAFPPAALFELYDEGYRSVFEVLVACIISIRTRDEETVKIARRFFAVARRPEEISSLNDDEIAAGIAPSQFARAKAGQIRQIAAFAAAAGGDLPCDEARLLELPGVGPKCANLALGIACGPGAAPHVGVDIHVHRVINRWGIVAEKTPEKTMAALDEVLPSQYRAEINRLLVPFGKHICTGVRPKCVTCPLLRMCRQVGVGNNQ